MERAAWILAALTLAARPASAAGGSTIRVLPRSVDAPETPGPRSPVTRRPQPTGDGTTEAPTDPSSTAPPPAGSERSSTPARSSKGVRRGVSTPRPRASTGPERARPSEGFGPAIPAEGAAAGLPPAEAATSSNFRRSRGDEALILADAPEPSRQVVPWVTLGASVALGVLGAVFAAEAAKALETQSLELEVEGDRAELTEAFRDTQGRVITNTIASTALFSAAAAGTLVSLLFLLDG